MDKKERVSIAACRVNDAAMPGKTVIFAVQLMKQEITPHMAKMVGCTHDAFSAL